MELTESTQPTVFLVEDDAAICESLCDLMESAGLVTQKFSSAEEFLRADVTDRAGCLILDVRLPGMSGMELQNRLAKSGNSLPIIIMTAHGDIPMVRSALKAGAMEFLTKPFQEQELLSAVEQAFAVDREQRRTRLQDKEILERWRTLSDRERQVLAYVTAGLLNKQIADKLKLSLVTVKMYRGQLMDKMAADSFAHLVKMWERLKLVEEVRATLL